MKRTVKRTLIVVGFLLLGMAAVIADDFDVIASNIRVGNAHGIATYFDRNVDIKTDDKSITYSRNQAELVLREFFHRNVPRSYTIIHKGTSAKGAQYFIGNLETNQGNFRSFVYVKEMNQKEFIEQMSFEKQ